MNRIFGVDWKIIRCWEQTSNIFCARFFRNEEPIAKSKKGAVILVGNERHLYWNY